MGSPPGKPLVSDSDDTFAMAHAKETIVLAYFIFEHQEIADDDRVKRKKVTVRWRLKGFLENDFAGKDHSNFPIQHTFVVRNQLQPTSSEWKSLAPKLSEFIEAGTQWHIKNPKPAAP